jgi:CO/xanthine dehydrogenase Mo-binding subunit
MIHGNFESKNWDYDHHVVPPVSHTTAYRLSSLERGARGFVQFASADEHLSGHIPIYIYDRLDEPTRSMLEENLAYAEGGDICVTFATGMAVVQASKKIVDELRARAALIWDVDVDGVVWDDGHAKPAGSNVGDFAPLSLREIAAKKALTGGPLTASAAVNAGGQAPGFTTQFCDVEVDPETGKVTVLRFVAAQDVGKAIHPSYVEGQIQGGVTQGIGWALNEEYIYDKQGRLDNPGFLDYRVPVAPDIPMIEAVLVEVPNPAHPYGAKGVGEVNICPPMAAIANAIDNAIGRRLTELPMSPPKVRAALDAGAGD